MTNQNNKNNTILSFAPLKKFAAYARVSQETERTGSHTFQTQSEEILNLLNRTYGESNFEVEWFMDDGVSGAYGAAADKVHRRTRPGFNEWLKAIATGAYDGVVVFSISRLSRDTFHILDVIRNEIKPRKMLFHSVQENLDIYTPEGVFALTVLGSAMTFQRDDMVKRAVASHVTSFNSGYPVGRVGYGWRRETAEEIKNSSIHSRDTDSVTNSSQSLETPTSIDSTASTTRLQCLSASHGAVRPRVLRVPEQGAVVVQMKDWFLSGLSVPKIAARLNQQKIPTARGHEEWSARTVRRVLFDPIHAGYVKRHEEIRQGEHFARRYYDPEVYEQMLARQRRCNQAFKTNTSRSMDLYFLNGLVFCDHCGSRLCVSSPNTIWASFRCINGIYQGKRTCPQLTVRMAPLEEAVIAQLRHLTGHPEMQQLLAEEALVAVDNQDDHLRSEVRRLQGELTKQKKRLDALFDRLTDGLIDEADFREQRGRLQSEQESLSQRKAEIESQLISREQRQAQVSEIQQLACNFEVSWLHLTTLERHALLENLVESLRIHRVENRRTLKLKMHLLPEVECAIHYPRRNSKKYPKTGVAGLKKRCLVVLYYILQGHPVSEIAGLMDINPSSLRGYIRRIRGGLGVYNLQEAANLAKTRIDKELHTLPLGSSKVTYEGEKPLLGLKHMVILNLMSQGAQVQEMVEVTGLPKSTIDSRRQLIYAALDVKTPFQAVRKAQALGLFDKK